MYAYVFRLDQNKIYSLSLNHRNLNKLSRENYQQKSLCQTARAFLFDKTKFIIRREIRDRVAEGREIRRCFFSNVILSSLN